MWFPVPDTVGLNNGIQPLTNTLQSPKLSTLGDLWWSMANPGKCGNLVQSLADQGQCGKPWMVSGWPGSVWKTLDGHWLTRVSVENLGIVSSWSGSAWLIRVSVENLELLFALLGVWCFRLSYARIVSGWPVSVWKTLDDHSLADRVNVVIGCEKVCFVSISFLYDP